MSWPWNCARMPDAYGSTNRYAAQVDDEWAPVRAAPRLFRDRGATGMASCRPTDPWSVVGMLSAANTTATARTRRRPRPVAPWATCLTHDRDHQDEGRTPRGATATDTRASSRRKHRRDGDVINRRRARRPRSRPRPPRRSVTACPIVACGEAGRSRQQEHDGHDRGRQRRPRRRGSTRGSSRRTAGTTMAGSRPPGGQPGADVEPDRP